jgi:hypothetical protein
MMGRQPELSNDTCLFAGHGVINDRARIRMSYPTRIARFKGATPR